MVESELDRFCGFAERFLTSENGRSLVVEDWQREILEDYFAGTRELVVLVSKKNGKTSLFAGLALWHVLTEPFADVAVLAASREQAGKLLQQLTGYIKRNASLRSRLKVTQRVVNCPATTGKVAVLAADSDTLDGWGGTLALVDELGRHRSAENFGLLRDGLGPRSGRLVAFSTAGDDEDSALGQLRSAAHAMPGFERAPDNPKHKRVRRDGFAFHEWSLDSPEEADRLELVKLANPASWIDEAELRARRDSPSMARWQWERFTCGLWVAGAESAISPDAWSACAAPGTEIPAGTGGVLVGVDLGWKHDFSAFVPIAGVDGDVHVHPPTILKPAGDGTALDSEDVFAVARQMAERWPQATFILDPEAGGEQLAQRIERELNARVAVHSQKSAPMCTAAMRLSEAINAKKIRHPDDEELNRHVLAAGAQIVGAEWKFKKPGSRKRKIDALVALSMAVSVLVGGGAAPRKLKGGFFGGQYMGPESPEEVKEIMAERKPPKKGGSGKGAAFL